MSKRQLITVDREMYESERRLFRDAIREVAELINNTQGVAGYHLNGDIAYWDELRSGGRCCVLERLDEAEALIAAEDAMAAGEDEFGDERGDGVLESDATGIGCVGLADEWDDGELCDE